MTRTAFDTTMGSIDSITQILEASPIMRTALQLEQIRVPIQSVPKRDECDRIWRRILKAPERMLAEQERAQASITALLAAIERSRAKWNEE